MTIVLAHLVPRPSSARCWSCNFDWDLPRRDRHARATWYEQAVETIEATAGDEFSIAGLAPALRAVGVPTPDAYDMLRHAVYDMRLHGLIECARRDRSGRMCLSWRVRVAR